MPLGGRYLTDHELQDVGFRSLGRNVRVHERASLYGLPNISLGDDVRIDDFAVVIATGPVEIGNFVSIHNFCFVGGTFGIRLDDCVTLAPGCKLFSSSDDYSGEWLTGPVVPRELTGGHKGRIHLHPHVIVGAGSVILPGCDIGDGAAIGALSLVKDSLEPWGVYAGVPAKRIRARSKTLLRHAATLPAHPRGTTP